MFWDDPCTGSSSSDTRKSIWKRGWFWWASAVCSLVTFEVCPKLGDFHCARRAHRKGAHFWPGLSPRQNTALLEDQKKQATADQYRIVKSGSCSNSRLVASLSVSAANDSWEIQNTWGYVDSLRIVKLQDPRAIGQFSFLEIVNFGFWNPNRHCLIGQKVANGQSNVAFTNARLKFDLIDQGGQRSLQAYN